MWPRRLDAVDGAVGASTRLAKVQRQFRDGVGLTQDDGYGKVIAKLRPGAEFRSGTFPTHRFSFCLATAHERIDDRDRASGDRVALPEGIIVKSHVVTSERDVTVTASAPSSLLDGHVSCRRSPCRTSADKARCPRQCPGRASRWGRASSRPSEEDLFSRGREL